MNEYLIITFKSTHAAIKTEKMLEHLNIEVIPTPRQLSTSCGIAIKAEIRDLEVIENIMGEATNELSQSYIVSNEDQVKTFRKV